MPAEARPHGSKIKFLDAALHLFRAHGYAATTVDDICARAALTKGSFFHHFDSKEALAIAAARHFSKLPEGCSPMPPIGVRPIRWTACSATSMFAAAS